MPRKLVRWSAVAFFALASAWNYLDRLVLSAAAPRVRAEFHLSNLGYSWLVSAFGLSYAAASPLIGWFLDRVGIEAGIVCAVSLWSAASFACAASRGFGQLLGARLALGAAEAAGIPAAQKLNATYLESDDLALGSAMTQVGLSIGGIGAPLLTAALPGWREPFFVCAALGLAWLPLWMLVRSRTRRLAVKQERIQKPDWKLMRNPWLLTLAAANVLWMGIYVLWSNWTTPYLTQTFHMTVRDVARFAWVPPVASTLGAFAGGWISRALIRRGTRPVAARTAAALASAIGCLTTLAAPLCPTPFLATIVISSSYFWATAGSVNLYTIAVDIWGGARAGTSVAALVAAYGLLQTGISPVFGRIVDLFGFAPVCWLVALPPFAGWWLLTRISKAHAGGITGAAP